jgi:hypothetical protein
MLRFLLVPLVALSLHLPVAGQADEAREIAAVKAAIDSLDQAFISGDASAIKALVTPEHIAIGPTYDGPVSIDEQLGFSGESSWQNGTGRPSPRLRCYPTRWR